MRALVLLAMVGCADTASSDLGLGDLLYVDAAQYRPGAFPEATGGPPVTSAQTAHSTIVADTHREPLHAILDPTARSVIVGIPGARGTWIVPAGAPDTDTPDQPSVHATLGFGAALPLGPFELWVAAVDDAGRIGDPAAVDLFAAPDLPPDGDLVVTLAWAGTADLDIHVVDGAGGEAWEGHPNTWQQPPPGTPGVDPCAWATGGILDRDANSGCTRSGRTTEDVVWVTRDCAGKVITPLIPAGSYRVRVETRALCNDASAPWAVSVYQAGVLVGAARGIATPYDATYGPHGAGAGITALQFTQ
jgi:hypothetical protein